MPKDFRPKLHNLLNDIGSHNANESHAWNPKFDPKYFVLTNLEVDEVEEREAVFSLFERTGLDPKQPGHWQFLLILVAGHMYTKRTGRKVFWDDAKEDGLFKAVLKIRKRTAKSKVKSSVEGICKQLVQTPKYVKIDAATLYARFNIVLRKRRKQAKSGDAPIGLIADLKWFAPN